MNQKVGVPAIIVAVIAALALGFVLYKQFLGPAPTNSGQTKYPDFIDPVTKKPKAGAASSSGSVPARAGGMGGTMGGSAGAAGGR